MNTSVIKKKMGISMSKKMIITYVLLVLLPACAMVYFYYLKSSSIIENEVTSSLLQTLEQSQINISNKLNNIADTSEELFMDKRVKEFVGDENNSNIPLQIDQVKELREVFTNLTSKRDSYRIRMFVSDKKIASGERVFFYSIQDVMNREWYEKAVDRKGGLVWTGVYKENYIDTGDVNVISCARILKHSYNYNDNDGVLLVDLPEENISSILSGIKLGKRSIVYIIDSEGKIISHENKEKLGKSFLGSEELNYINSETSGIKKIDRDGKEVFLIFQVVEATGWKMVAEVDSKDIIEANIVFNNISVFVVIIITFIIFVFVIFLIFAHAMEDMNKQVKNLAGAIEKEGIEIIDEGVSSTSKGELTRLEKNVFGMMQKVKNLMEESYQSKIREREAQLKALQAQINPHFLYNTLDTINWMAVKINAADISFMVNSLARYFRLSLSKGKSIVSIKDELELIKVYLTIQQVRFKGTIQFEFDVAEDVESYNIHKLTLQPIVENAIIHGIQKNKDRSGTITIQAKKYNEDIVFTISDNGVGMDSEMVDRVLNNLPNGKEGSYGLYNVNERIKLYFGEEYGIRIYSEKGRGTKIEIKIKAM